MNKDEIMIRRDYYGKFDSTIKEIKKEMKDGDILSAEMGIIIYWHLCQM